MRRKHESPILNARREMPQKALLFECAEEQHGHAGVQQERRRVQMYGA